MTSPMQGFPPAPDQQVTLANWRTAPFNRWAFHHVREIVPSADIPSDPARTAQFPPRPVHLGKLQIDADRGNPLSFAEFLDATGTDGLVIVNRGEIAFESYANGMTAETPHILMSVSKFIAKVSSQALPMDPERIALTMRAVAAIRQFLAGAPL